MTRFPDCSPSETAPEAHDGIDLDDPPLGVSVLMDDDSIAWNGYWPVPAAGGLWGRGRKVRLE